jgi:hypothetical protein
MGREVDSQPSVSHVTSHLRQFQGLSVLPPTPMLKRQSSGPKTARKKKKGNATYGFTSLDPVEDKETTVEDIRVWNISTSEKTGRVKASRRNLKRHRQPSPEERSASKKAEGVEEAADVEESGILADSESAPVTVDRQRPKRTRVRVVKENDSVSGLSVSPPIWTYPHFQTRMEH